MKSREIRQAIEKAREYESFLRSDEYINAQLARVGLDRIGLQMGPNCNSKACSHCYGDYGPHRKGLPKQEIIQKTLEDAAEFSDYFTGVVLTDGEPLRHENKSVIETIANYSDKVPAVIMTNGIFANTTTNAFRWMNLLKENGFDLGRKINCLHLSFGTVYNVDFRNYFRINEAVKNVFSKVDFGKHLVYGLIGVGKSKEENRMIYAVATGLKNTFGERKHFDVSRSENGGLALVNTYPEKGSPIKISYRPVAPDGRANKNFGELFDTLYPEKKLEVEDLGFSPDTQENLWVSHKGDVGFGISGACVRPGKIYGNVMDDHLVKILDRIREDPIYNAFKVGGARFVYHLGQRVDPSFVTQGRIRCDACHDFFNNPELVRTVRRSLIKEGVAGPYKEFIDSIDLRKKLIR